MLNSQFGKGKDLPNNEQNAIKLYSVILGKLLPSLGFRFLSSKWSRAFEHPPKPFLVWNAKSSINTSLGSDFSYKDLLNSKHYQTLSVVFSKNTWRGTNEVKQIGNSVIDAIINVCVHRRVDNFIVECALESKQTLKNSWHLIEILKHGQEFTR